MKKIPWVFLLVLLSLLSYFRETVFLGINEIIEQNFSNHPYTFKPEILFQYSSAELSKLKYIITGIFTIVFAAYTILALRMAFKDKLAFKMALFAYSFAFILILLAALSTYILFDFAQVYPFIRTIIGYIHSPIPYLIISTTVLVADFYKKDV